ncbi:MAG: sel1 repeat family protein [Planctomycetes bacterium]|nr:sel1 repeat family protein [Planctomycetota bacterium]
MRSKLAAVGVGVLLLAGRGVGQERAQLPDPSPSDTQRAYTLRRMLFRQDYAEALEALNGLHALGRKRGDYRDALERTVARIPATAPDMECLDALVARYPEEPLPRLVRGTQQISYAWVARGSGYAASVSEDGAKLFRERIELAGEDLARARELDPQLAMVCATQIIVARAQGRPEAEVRELFRRALELDPGCFKAYRSVLEYLKPKWHGTAKGMLEFVEQAVAANPDRPELRMLLTEAWTELIPHAGSDLAPYFAAHPEEVARFLEAYDAVIAAYPRATEPLMKRLELVRAVTKEDALPYVHALARAGHETYQWQLYALLIDERPEEALAWLETAARNKCQGAAANLSNFYVLGSYGLPVDPQAAFGWLGQAATLGNLDAQQKLGMRYLEGQGTTRDEAKARIWLELAATRGDASAMNSYAICLALGQGGPVDQELAFTWFQRGAAAGSTGAMLALGGAYENGAVGPPPGQYRIEVDLRRALGYYRAAAERGHARARQLYGRLLQAHPELGR